MRRMYEMPRAFEEEFVANEYIAACYDYHAELYCAIPGKSMNYVNDGTQTRKEYDTWGVWHGGPCTSNNSCDITGSTGMENATKHKITNVKIGETTKLNASVNRNIGSIPSTLTDGYYKATWENDDDSGNHYMHYGIAQISSVLQDPNRPNHS